MDASRSGDISRIGGLVWREVGSELAVYNPTTVSTHALEPAAAAVFLAVGDTVTIDDLVVRLGDDGWSEDVVIRALDELAAADLITIDVPDGDAMSRRRLLGRIGVGALAVTALPLVQTVIAPTAAAALSGGGGGGGGLGGPSGTDQVLTPTSPTHTVIGLFGNGQISADNSNGQPYVDINVWLLYSDGSIFEVTNLATNTISGSGSSTIGPSPWQVSFGPGHNVITSSYQGYTYEYDVWGIAAVPAGPAGTLRRIENTHRSMWLTDFAGADPATIIWDVFQFSDGPDSTTSYTGSNNSNDLAGATWTTSNASVVDVTTFPDGHAEVTLMGTGTATITSHFGGFTADTQVFVPSGFQVRLNGVAFVVLGVGSSAQAGLWEVTAGLPSGSAIIDHTGAATWTSSNPSVATVDDVITKGFITPLTAGTTTITATVGANSATYDLTVA